VWSSMSSRVYGLSIRADTELSAGSMAMPTAIQTELDVAANKAAPTQAPIATPTPVLTPDGLSGMEVTVLPKAVPTVSTATMCSTSSVVCAPVRRLNTQGQAIRTAQVGWVE
jgi:hypothetical protein